MPSMRWMLPAAAVMFTVGCASPLDPDQSDRWLRTRALPRGVEALPSSAWRDDRDAMTANPADADLPALDEGATLADYRRYALLNNPGVEAAYQRWLAMAERVPQVRALPDPRVTFGVFLNEVETRVGPQQARMGVSQMFPWFGKLAAREDAASRSAMAAFRQFEARRLVVVERVTAALQEARYLDAALALNDENLALLQQFEEIVRARYRVGQGGHPDLARVQVELGKQEDRIRRLRDLRPVVVAQLNAALNRPANAAVPPLTALAEPVVELEMDALIDAAGTRNPELAALLEQIEAERAMTKVARLDGYPEFTVGVDYIFTGDAMNSSINESGDDPVILNFGLSLPLWREKYEAGVRESTAKRLALGHEHAERLNQLSAEIHRAAFEHEDAQRRIELYENTLIPKADESLGASLGAFRTGEASFLDLLDTERTLLEFRLMVERARADRAIALAKLETLTGGALPTAPVDSLPEDGAVPEELP